ncbi:MAG: glucosaminidase domain-containing protein [Venatoribacter sp.]
MKIFAFFFLALFILTGCKPSSDIASTQDDGQNICTAPDLALPDDIPNFEEISDSKLKKQAFFDYFLPIIYQENSKRSNEQELFSKWLTQPNKLSKAETEAFSKLLTTYQIKSEDPEEIKTLLQRRVQPLPPSLVLAQAANESAWGTSRFAQEGNNYFGQWCFSIGCGLIPGERNHRAKHEVRVFASPQQSVASYMRNLNTHPQYQDLRTIRLQELEQQGYASGLALAEGLSGYSERGEEYVAEIQQMIRYNKLDQLDPMPQGCR